MSEETPHCGTCPYHRTTVYRIEQLEKDYEELHRCYSGIKGDMADTRTNQAILVQKFENLKYPIWVIFGMALLQVGRYLITFAPVTEIANAFVK